MNRLHSTAGRAGFRTLGIAVIATAMVATVLPASAAPAVVSQKGLPRALAMVPFHGSWTNLTSKYSTAPLPSWGWAAAYDDAYGKVVMFGGCGYALGTPCTNQTWVFSGPTGWIELNNGTGPGPSPRQGPALSYDPLLRAVVLFGGDGYGSILGDTWEWKGGSWHDLTASLAIAPPARYDSRMAWDPAVGAIVLFSGSGCGAGACSDTWEFNGTWSQVTTAHTPPQRAWPGLVFDKFDGYLLLTSGQGISSPGVYTHLNDTWEFNGTDWVQLHPRESPPAVDQPAVAYDTNAARVLYVGDHNGLTWLYRHGIWTNITASLASAPSARGLPGMCFDRADGYVLLFGGGSAGALNDTWAWS